jgi:hypothetical protein
MPYPKGRKDGIMHHVIRFAIALLILVPAVGSAQELKHLELAKATEAWTRIADLEEINFPQAPGVVIVTTDPVNSRRKKADFYGTAAFTPAGTQFLVRAVASNGDVLRASYEFSGAVSGAISLPIYEGVIPPGSGDMTFEAFVVNGSNVTVARSSTQGIDPKKTIPVIGIGVLPFDAKRVQLVLVGVRIDVRNTHIEAVLPNLGTFPITFESTAGGDLRILFSNQVFVPTGTNQVTICYGGNCRTMYFEYTPQFPPPPPEKG